MNSPSNAFSARATSSELSPVACSISGRSTRCTSNLSRRSTRYVNTGKSRLNQVSSMASTITQAPAGRARGPDSLVAAVCTGGRGDVVACPVRHGAGCGVLPGSAGGAELDRTFETPSVAAVKGGQARSASAWHGRQTVSYTHLRAHETVLDLVCRLL